MNYNEVPQDKALFGEDHEIQYAVDRDGHYKKIQSTGWTSKTIANSQFWKLLLNDIRFTVKAVQKGEKSPIAYYMLLKQMYPELLASYTGLWRWRIKRHIKPRVFKKLNDNILKKYADVFEISIQELKKLPDDPENPKTIRHWAELTD